MYKGHPVMVRRGRVWHYGVSRGDGTVVEHAGKDGGVGQIVTVEQFGRGERILVLPRSSHISPDEAVSRAEHIVHAAPYDALDNNCEAMTNWAVHGRAYSGQSERLKAFVAGGGAAGLAIGSRIGVPGAMLGLIAGILVGGAIGFLTN